jgi:hypothetical protein
LELVQAFAENVGIKPRYFSERRGAGLMHVQAVLAHAVRVRAIKSELFVLVRFVAGAGHAQPEFIIRMAAQFGVEPAEFGKDAAADHHGVRWKISAQHQ